jgi:hypothetical protein
MMRKTILLAFAALLAELSPTLAQTPAATTNASVTITLGSAFQSLLAAITGTTPRRSLTIQNNNINGDNCWIYIGPNASATKATAILLGPGGSYQRYTPYIPSDNISATCATTADTLYVDTQ